MKGLETFDSTIQKSTEWVKDIMAELKTEDRHKALLALRAVLQTLRNRLTLEESAEFAAQLPLLIRGIFYEGWRPSEQPLKDRHKEQFLSHIPHFFKNEPDINAEEIARAVFKVIAKRISAGEMDDIRGIVPEELRDLLPEPVHH